MKKTFSLKSLSAIALFCFLASHSDLQTQNMSVLEALNIVRESDTIYTITKTGVIERLEFVNAGCIDLNAKLFEANNKNISIEQLEQLQKYQTYLIFEFDFIEKFSKQFSIKDKQLLTNLQTVKNNIELISVNTKTLTDNYYNRNATNQAANLILNKLIEVVKLQYPYLSGLIDLFLKYNGIVK